MYRDVEVVRKGAAFQWDLALQSHALQINFALCWRIPSGTSQKIYLSRGTTVAEWIRLHLPFCGKGLNPITPSMLFPFIVKFRTIFSNRTEKRRKINKNAWFGTYLKIFFSLCAYIGNFLALKIINLRWI